MNYKKLVLATLGAIVVITIATISYSILRTETQPEAWTQIPAPAFTDLPQGEFTLQIQPRAARIDQPISIKVTDLEPNEQIVLRASTFDANGILFESWARFTANESGELDIGSTIPTAGTYRSNDSSGLLWSMESANQARFQHSESWESRSYEISAETSEGRVTSIIERIYPWSNLRLQEISTNEVEAELWLSKYSDSPLPVVIRLPGSDGRISRIKSSILSHYGFAVLDLRYHRGEGSGMPSQELIPLERVTTAIDWIEENAEIYNLDSSRIGLYGTSKGAELALLVGGKDSRISALTAWAPASVVFEGSSLRALYAGSSWTWLGEPLPFTQFRNHIAIGAMVFPRLFAGKSASFLPYYIDALDHADIEASIPVQDIEIPVLLMGGNDDRLWPSARMIQALVDSSSSESDIEYEIYDNVGHVMNYEIWPRGGTPDGFILGGNRESNYLAGREAWAKLILFFQENI